MSRGSGSGGPLTTLKLIVVGDSGVGKSCMLHRFVDDVFNEEQTQTIGVEFGAKVVSLNGQRIKLQVWDTAGQERYRSVTRSYYRGAVGGLVVYDVTNRDSYKHVSQWLADVRQLAGADVTVMLIGNKTDIAATNPDRRKVTHTEASVFAQENGVMHLETSAQSGEFVPDAFLRVARTTLMKQQQAQQIADHQSGGGGSGAGGNTRSSAHHHAKGGSGGRARLLDDEEDGTGEHDAVKRQGAATLDGTVRLQDGGNADDGEGGNYCSKC